MRLLSRSVWLAAAISIVAAAFPAVGNADQSSCQPGPSPVGGDSSTAGGVNVHLTANHTVIWCSAQVIEANRDITDGTTYQVRSAKLSPSSTPVSNAISVGALLTLAGVPPTGVDHADIERLNGASSRLDGSDLTDPSARFVGGAKPIFWINGSETQYLRPLRGPSDTNGGDQIVASNGAPLDFYVYSGPVLNVSASATPAKVGIEQSVAFTAHVTNTAAGDGTLTYRWAFQDGSTATGASVSHRYGVAGTWYPVVSVQGAGNDSGGASKPVPVVVGAPRTDGSGNAPGGTNRNQNAPTGGANRSRGKTPKAAPSHKNSGGSGSKKASGRRQAPAQSGPVTPQPTTPSQSATPQRTRPVQSTRTSPGASAHTPAREPHRAAAKPKRSSSTKQTLPQRNPATTRIKGRLVSDVIPVSAIQLAQQNSTGPSPRSARAPSARHGGSVPPLAGIAGACVIILLLGSGAGRELRSQHRSVSAPRAA